MPSLKSKKIIDNILYKINRSAYLAHSFTSLKDSSHPNGIDPLLFALRNHYQHNLIFTNKEIDYLVKNSNLKNYCSEYQQNALMYVLAARKCFGLSAQQINYLIRNSDLKHLSSTKENALFIAIINADVLPQINWDYLINHSDVFNIDKAGLSCFLPLIKNKNIKLLNMIFKKGNFTNHADLAPFITSLKESSYLKLVYRAEEISSICDSLLAFFEDYLVSHKIKKEISNSHSLRLNKI